MLLLEAAGNRRLFRRLSVTGVGLDWRHSTGSSPQQSSEGAMEKHFTRIANAVAYAAGKPATFIACMAIIIIWAVTGPLFGFSDTWQLIVNTGTTIITFLMVFLIQNTQNRDGAALQAKLDELIRVSRARNHFIGIEHLTETEVEDIRKKCEQAARRADQQEAA
jgi:low affinity Fe/Cu permease